MTYLWCCFEVLLITGQLSEQLELVVLQDINTLKASNNVKCYHWPNCYYFISSVHNYTRKTTKASENIS